MSSFSCVAVKRLKIILMSTKQDRYVMNRIRQPLLHIQTNNLTFSTVRRDIATALFVQENVKGEKAYDRGS